ncbi:uncharacterized protein LOC131218724 isoform X4 [Magnolia sinica]|uniref:uncharacterized protein LOC131218724 isoform X4 n=1 Tax=Magnolia sinica TaxID=86752 RepID=UPI00265A7923|nr:uncharacterized protein LOC131218724 isoform X4 [Magnolia sinica]
MLAFLAPNGVSFAGKIISGMEFHFNALLIFRLFFFFFKQSLSFISIGQGGFGSLRELKDEGCLPETDVMLMHLCCGGRQFMNAWWNNRHQFMKIFGTICMQGTVINGLDH